MPDLESLNKYTEFVIRIIPIIGLISLWLKPVRRALGKWFSESVTFDVRADMNAGFKQVTESLSEMMKNHIETKEALHKAEALQTRRHRSNQKEIRSTKREVGEAKNIAVTLGKELKQRLDDHLIDHGKDGTI